MFTVCTEAESTPCSTTVMVIVQPRSLPILCLGLEAGFYAFIIGILARLLLPPWPGIEPVTLWSVVDVLP